VLLRGVNRSGLEYSPTLAGAGMSAAEVQEMTGAWGANIIRLPFNQQWALERPEYLEELDQFIDWAALCGAYTLLDLQWLDSSTVYGTLTNGRANHIAPLPDERSKELWAMLAARHASQPAVLFDIYNEPHDPLPDDVTAGQWPQRVTSAEWQSAAERLIAIIRAACPDKLVFVSGVDWGYDLRGLAFEASGVVLSTHVYPGKTLAWSQAFGLRSASAPVFAGEWGGGEEDLGWGRELASYLGALGMGWTAWSWADWPHLVVPPAAAPWQPTPFGELVRGLLRRGSR
jgi:endoglucanase